MSSDTNIATVDRYGNIYGVAAGECTVTVTSTSNSAVYAEVKVKVKAEVTELTYIDGILIANKTYALPKTYAPGWNTEGAAQLNVMFAAAQTEGIYLKMQSGYRSYTDQYIIYNDYVARDGQAAADRYSARPGHSEHQTGLAFDLTTTYYNGLWEGFADTPEGKWVAENCHKYGFIIRYPKEKEHITGYMYEPWHVRYIGVEKATAVYESGLCLEEYLNITSSYS
ncbi:MAG: D-alanyl-D-alanine carboxypeptidase family protein [Clostridia bacterium]|nr:D-alanyl-D-alanine carboxypeptidase family protein [Oscillospiraceae bacterium]MBQ6701699.1 D-alanyl-D-alanine carboxypeptidase family protein [Clostridia bacterium]